MKGLMFKICALLCAVGVMAEQTMPNKKRQTEWAPTKLDVESFILLVVNDKGKMISKKPWFIKYYAPWCTHCQALEPIWDEFNAKHQDEINVGSVDCTTQGGQELCEAM